MPMMLPNNSAPYQVALRPAEVVALVGDDVEREDVGEALEEDVGGESCGESCSGGCAWIRCAVLVDNGALTR